MKRQFQDNGDQWDVRDLLESTATPFAIADYGPRAAIFLEGDQSDSVMHIESGRVWLAVTARRGKEAICGLLDTGAFLGEEAITGYNGRRQSAIAMTATQVLVVAKAHMIRLLRTQPELAERFIAHLLARSIRLETNLKDHLLYSSEERLAHILLLLAGGDERCRSRCGLPDLPQEIIAEMVGTTRSRVSAFMSKFKKLGFVEQDNGVLYVNPARLHDVHDGGRRPAIAGAARIPRAPKLEARCHA